MLKAREELLVLAAQQGNEQAFSYLCQHYQAPLLRFGYKLCSDSQLVQDAVQNCWLKVSRNLRILEDPRAFKSWLFRTLRWCVYDLMRQMVREQEMFSEQTREAWQETQSTKQSEGNNDEELMLLISVLPAIERQAIHLFYLEEMKVTEIADILQIPSGTVKSRLNRARNLLKQKVEMER